MHVLVTAQWCNDGTANVMSACLLAQQELALLAFAEEERTDWMAVCRDLDCSHLKAITLFL
eukprot:scaffold53355_cov22-Tisochrysis_lutea.AAC.1